MYTSTTVQAELCARCRHGHTHTLTDMHAHTHARTRTHTHIHTLTDRHTCAHKHSLSHRHTLSLSQTHTYTLTLSLTDGHKHTRTVQTDRGEGQGSLTEIFGHRNLWHYLTERLAKTTSTSSFKLEKGHLTVPQWLPFSQKGWAKWQGETSCIHWPKGICNHLSPKASNQKTAWAGGGGGGGGGTHSPGMASSRPAGLRRWARRRRRPGDCWWAAGWRTPPACRPAWSGLAWWSVRSSGGTGPSPGTHSQTGWPLCKQGRWIFFKILFSWCGVLCDEGEN